MYIQFLFICFMISQWIPTMAQQQAQAQATNRRFNITAPMAESVYVAGQIVPVTYTLPDDATLSSTLGLAVYFTSRDPSLPYFEATISDNADLSQGFSFRRTANTLVYYEHQLNYGIPKEAKAGNYQITFTDTKGGGNTSVPITVRPYSSSAGSTTSTNKSPQASNIFLQGNAASSIPILFYGPLTGFLSILFWCLV